MLQLEMANVNIVTLWCSSSTAGCFPPASSCSDPPSPEEQPPAGGTAGTGGSLWNEAQQTGFALVNGY